MIRSRSSVAGKDDRGKDVDQVVRDAAGEGADALQALGLEDLAFEKLPRSVTSVMNPSTCCTEPSPASDGAPRGPRPI